jgi:hypothetical protein
MDTITITRFRGDWYSFEKIPQEGRYIKVGALRFSTDRKAINTAKKINPNYKYVVAEE